MVTKVVTKNRRTLLVLEYTIVTTTININIVNILLKLKNVKYLKILTLIGSKLSYNRPSIHTLYGLDIVCW